MITLKDYQNRVLNSLREFFRLCSKTGSPSDAFYTVTGGDQYLPIHAAGLARDMPYVCLRVPTGGELTEEFKCAQFIDSKLPGVRFWVRNLQRRSTSFRLQTSTDWFYPDFVCQLDDGRILVIEYKGAHLLNAPDAEEKRDIGNLWAARSNGRCLFVMPSDNRFDEIVQKVKS